MVNSEIRTFETLHVWQESQNLAVLIYQTTKRFPKEELYGIVDQLKRASSSISANIAEGYGRSTSLDQLHFYTIAYGSLLETKNFIYLAERLHYIDSGQKDRLIAQCVICQKLLNGFKRSIRASDD